MLGQAERYLKQAIVDREAYVASAALVSGMHLMKGSPAGVDIVRVLLFFCFFLSPPASSFISMASSPHEACR
jgi:hypothetical protein